MHEVLCLLFSVALLYSYASPVLAVSIEEQNELMQYLELSYGDKQNASIATGENMPINRAPSISSVVTSQDIAAMGATTLEHALVAVPGLYVSYSNIVSMPMYNFRGVSTTYNPQILFLINGVPITQGYGGHRGFSVGNMQVENIARVEVIRGPGSALYGADAMSGVINVITKQADNINGTQFGARLGSFNSKDAWLLHGSKLGGVVDVAFYVSAGETDGYKGVMERDAQSSWDDFFATQIPNYKPVSLAPGKINTQAKNLTSGLDLSSSDWRLRVGYLDSRVAIGGGLGGSIDPIGGGRLERKTIDLSYNKRDWRLNWDVSAMLSYGQLRDVPDPMFVLFPPGSFGGAFKDGFIGNPGRDEITQQVSASLTYRGLSQHKFRLGVGHKELDMYKIYDTRNFKLANGGYVDYGGIVDVSNDPSVVHMLPHNRDLDFVYVQDEWRLMNDWTFTVGVRRDVFSDFGGTTNPRIALVWDAAYNLTFKAMRGSAFRAPSFNEMYVVNNPVAIGNPHIHPERSQTDEFAIAWEASKDLHTSFNVYRYNMTDMITNNAGMFANVASLDGKGVEMEAIYDASRELRLTSTFSYQKTTDGVTGKNAGMTPQKRLFANADWRIAAWRLGGTLNYVMDIAREPSDTRPPLSDYATVDIIARRDKLWGDLDLRMGVNNLFNQKIYAPIFMNVGTTVPGNPVTMSDLPLAGRAIYLQLDYLLRGRN